MERWRWGVLLAVMVFCFGSMSARAEESQEESIDEAWNTEVNPEDLLNIEFDHYDNDISSYSANSFPEQVDNIVVFVRFKGDKEYVNNTSIGYADMTYNSDSNSLTKYLARISYGKVDISTHFFPCDNNVFTSVELSQTADYYKRQSNGNIGYTEGERISREIELITEIMSKVKDSLSSHTELKLDRDGDGAIDGISFVFPTLVGADSAISHGDLLWPHKVDNYINVDINGKHVYTYNVLSRGSQNVGIMGAYIRSSGTLIHEFLHTMGLPDLYRYNNLSAKPVGMWDQMDGAGSSPVNLTAYYQREYLGYGDSLEQIETTTMDIVLKKAEYVDSKEKYAVMIKSQRNNNEKFVVEYRQPEAGIDSQKQSGLIVYRIFDDNYSSGPFSTNGNADGPPDFLYIFRPGESDYNSADGELGYAPVSPSNLLGFSSLGKSLGTENSGGYDNQTIYYSDGSNSGIVVDNIREDVSEGSVTFDVAIPSGLTGEGTKNNPYVIESIEDLQTIGNYPKDTYFILAHDVDAGNFHFKPIENFQGILNGQDYTIRNLKVEGEAASFIAIANPYSEIKNIKFENINLNAESSYVYGSLIESADGKISNVHITSGTVYAQGRAGAIAGYLTGSIENSSSSATVTGNEAGGLVCYFDGVIKNSFTNGQVKGIGDGASTGAIGANYFHSGGNTFKLDSTVWDIDACGTSIPFGNKTEVPEGAVGLSVKLSKNEIKIGDEAHATIEFLKSANTQTPDGTWEASSPSLLSIDKTGKFSGLAQGISQISYVFENGGMTFSVSNEVSILETETNLPETESKETQVPDTKPAQEPETNQNEDSVEAFVERLYNLVLGRDAENAGRDNWVGQLKNGEKTGAEVAWGFFNSKEFIEKQLPDEKYLDILYKTFLGREADDGGKAVWKENLDYGFSRVYVLRGFAESKEFTEICERYLIKRGSVELTENRDKNSGVTKFVFNCYDKFLGRIPDVGGLNMWTGQLIGKEKSPKQIANSFVFSKEFKNSNLSNEEYVRRMYRGLFGREGDDGGVKMWTQALNDGKSKEFIFDGFADSEEFYHMVQQFGL